MNPRTVIAAMVISIAPALVAAQTPLVPAGSAGTVTLSRTDYDRLLDLAAQRPAGTATAPTAAALAPADILGRVGPTTARAPERVGGEGVRPGGGRAALIKNATLPD